MFWTEAGMLEFQSSLTLQKECQGHSCRATARFSVFADLTQNMHTTEQTCMCTLTFPRWYRVARQTPHQQQPLDAWLFLTPFVLPLHTDVAAPFVHA